LNDFTIFGMILNCATAIWNAPGMNAGLPSSARAKDCSSLKPKLSDAGS